MPAELLTEPAPIELRDRAARAAQWFTASETWLPLARALTEIRAAKVWRAWGFHSFSTYIEQELDLSRSVGVELVTAFRYLVFRHPECTAENRSAAEHIPSYTNLAMLARTRTRLPEETAELLDQGLFAGTIKRTALKEFIKKQLSQREAHEDTAAEEQARGDAEQHACPQYRELREVLEPLFDALDLAALREQIALVFDGWAEISGDERRQLLARLNCLIDRLQTIQQAIRQRPSPVGL